MASEDELPLQILGLSTNCVRMVPREKKNPRTSELLSGKGRRLPVVQVGTQGKAPSVSLPGNCTLGMSGFDVGLHA